jgi:hypothetical protein
MDSRSFGTKMNDGMAGTAAAGGALVRRMNQDTPTDEVPVVFGFRAWNSQRESWDDYLRAIERAYTQYLDRRRPRSAGEPPPQHPDPDEEMH